jgi:LysM repeat protein
MRRCTGGTYTVRPGDTLSQIAAWNGVSVGSLMSANGIRNPNIIFVGQVLIIP